MSARSPPTRIRCNPRAFLPPVHPSLTAPAAASSLRKRSLVLKPASKSYPIGNRWIGGDGSAPPNWKPESSGMESPGAFMGEPIRVLIVEDNPADAELMVRALRQAGFAPEWERVETEADYLAGLDAAPEVILSDSSLPRFDGIQALDLLKQRGLAIPFVLVSGRMEEDRAVE